MNAELEAIKDSWDKNTGDGRDEDGTRALCDAYVEAHPEQFEGLRKFQSDEDGGIASCVNALSVFRAAGMEEEQWKVEVWLLHNYEPQNIGGPIRAQVRIPGVSRG